MHVFALLSGVILEFVVTAQTEPRLLGNASIMRTCQLLLLDRLLDEVVEPCLQLFQCFLTFLSIGLKFHNSYLLIQQNLALVHHAFNLAHLLGSFIALVELQVHLLDVAQQL